MKLQQGRSRRPTRARVVSWAVLGLVGCVAALSYLFGDQLGRGLGLLALVAGAGLACLLAWREDRAAQRRREAHALHCELVHGEWIRAERARQRTVVEVLGRRVAAVHQRAELAGRRVSALQQELSTLRGNYEALRVELELQAALESDAQLVGLARREPVIDAWVTARELWSRDDAGVRRPA
ncbi:MAG: hypothetical protein QM619_07010 [Micropruina sp.]|uniref:hypothetical protein n=1 Tax=Micropruina sp. TaxID=2737536 RepID=UPI0039E72786